MLGVSRRVHRVETEDARNLSSVPRKNIVSVLDDDRIRVYAHPGHRQSSRLVKSSLRGLTAFETIDWVGLLKEYFKNYRDWICHDNRCSFSSVTLTASLSSKKIGSVDTNRCKSDPENVTESSYDPSLRDSLSKKVNDSRSKNFTPGII
ncbi:hypothetical protein V1478_013076 [Vespula squamosa]|uniref:Uncharacterized protein n=1 Tax=Vespula squamosa TaxID=30214 RepID=A0ABD2A9T8_VESSQ